MNKRHVSFLRLPLLFAGLVATLFGGGAVYAIGSVGPDGSISTSKPKFVLVKSDTTGDMSGSEVPIYFEKSFFESRKAAGGTITLKVKDVRCYNNLSCSGSGATNQYVGFSYGNGGTLGSTPTNSRVNDTTTFTLNYNKFSLDVDTNNSYYRTVVKMKLRNGNNGSEPNEAWRNRIMFRLEAGPDGGYVGAAVGNSASYVNLAANNPLGNSKYKYTIPFGSPCTQTSDAWASIKLYDLDSGNADNNGNTVTVTPYNAATNKKLSADDYSVSGSMGTTGEYSIRMKFKPDGKYKLVINGIHSMNMVQYKLPHDDIYYLADCTPPAGGVSLKSSALVRPSGTTFGTPTPSPDTLTGSGWSTSKDLTAKAGDIVYFKHRVLETTNTAEVSLNRGRERLIQNSDDTTVACLNGWTSVDGTDCWWAGGRANGKIGKGATAWYTASENDRRWGGGGLGNWYAGRIICERYHVIVASVSKYSSWQCVKVLEWRVEAETQVRVDSGAWQATQDGVRKLRPGQLLSFQHDISNNGEAVSPDLTGTEYLSYGNAVGWSPNMNIPALEGGDSLASPITGRESARIQSSDAGREFCSQFRVSRGTNMYDANQPFESNRICGYVPRNYNLTPSLNVASTTLEAGTVATLSSIGGGVRNEATNGGNNATDSKATDYKLRYFTTTNKQCVVNNPTTYASACAGSIGAFNDLSSGSVAILSPGGTATNNSNNFTLPTSIGSICFVLSVGKSGGEATITDDTVGAQIKSSAPSCVTLGKKPKVAITGGDVIVGRGRSGSTITSSNTTYPKNLTTPGADTATAGSWGEYSVFASGAVTNFGSGAGFANRQNTAAVTSLNVGVGNLSTACQYSMLTFTNLAVGVSAASGDLTTPACSATKGNYMVQSSARPLAALLKPTAVTAQTAWSSPAEGETVTRRYTSNQSIQGQNIKGTLIIAIQGNATITGNITLDDAVLKSAYTSGNFGNIPQVVIIASGNIIIEEGVTRVDAWLITEGASSIIRTCNKTGGKSVADCGSQLVVNGPVVTNKLELLRTAGAEVGQASDRGAKPAEMFNLRADAYLWARGYSIKNQSPVRTTFIKELSPRL